MNFEQWLQSRLTAHRYPVGPVDGVIGPTTINALKSFQKDHGLPQSGRADEATIEMLKTSASVTTSAEVVGIPDRNKSPDKETFQPSKTIWPRQSECMSYYGNVGTNQTQIEIPFDMVLAWDKSNKVKKMTLHERVAPSALRVFQRVAGIYSAAERSDLGLNIFGGSLNVRRMRGGTSYSMHSWGIAIDFDPERNQLKWGKPLARLSHADAVPFWAEWESEGWLSLGRAKNFDWMHVQAARL